MDAAPILCFSHSCQMDLPLSGLCRYVYPLENSFDDKKYLEVYYYPCNFQNFIVTFRNF